jgi:hypothetical protein
LNPRGVSGHDPPQAKREREERWERRRKEGSQGRRLMSTEVLRNELIGDEGVCAGHTTIRRE